MESSYRRFSVTAPIAASCVSLYATPHFVLRPVLSQLSMQFTSVRSLIFIIFREKRSCCVQISFSAHSSIPFFYRTCKVKIWKNKGRTKTCKIFRLPAVLILNIRDNRNTRKVGKRPVISLYLISTTVARMHANPIRSVGEKLECSQTTDKVAAVKGSRQDRSAAFTGPTRAIP